MASHTNQAQENNWFNVHELALIAYYHQVKSEQRELTLMKPSQDGLQTQSNEKDCSNIQKVSCPDIQNIEIVNQQNDVEILHQYMIDNIPCIVQNIDTNLNHFLPMADSSPHSIQSSGSSMVQAWPDRWNLDTSRTVNHNHFTHPSQQFESNIQFSYFSNPYFPPTIPPSKIIDHCSDNPPPGNQIELGLLHSLINPERNDTHNEPSLQNNSQSEPGRANNVYELLLNLYGTELETKLNESGINFDFFRQKYKNCTVSISNCGIRHSNSQKCEEMLFGEYLDQWDEHKKASMGLVQKDDKCISDQSENCYPFMKYCRDWHLAQHHFDQCVANCGHKTDTSNINNKNNNSQNDPIQFYTPPLCISNDYMNQYWDYLTISKSIPNNHNNQNLTQNQHSVRSSSSYHPPVDDYRFVYFGPHSSFTPLHRDVYSSYSWSGNVVGAKLWIFLPPNYVNLTQTNPISPTVDLYDIFNLELIQQCSAKNSNIFPQDDNDNNNRERGEDRVDLLSSLQNWIIELRQKTLALINHDQKDQLIDLKDDEGKPLTTLQPLTPSPMILLQFPGDLVFVPSFWAHQVVNLTDCVSINHNWANAYNLNLVTSQLILDNITIKAGMAEYKEHGGNGGLDEFVNEWEKVQNENGFEKNEQQHQDGQLTTPQLLNSILNGLEGFNTANTPIGYKLYEIQTQKENCHKSSKISALYTYQDILQIPNSSNLSTDDVTPRLWKINDKNDAFVNLDKFLKKVNFSDKKTKNNQISFKQNCVQNFKLIKKLRLFYNKIQSYIVEKKDQISNLKQQTLLLQRQYQQELAQYRFLEHKFKKQTAESSSTIGLPALNPLPPLPSPPDYPIIPPTCIGLNHIFDDILTEQRLLLTNSGMNTISLYQMLTIVTLSSLGQLIVIFDNFELIFRKLDPNTTNTDKFSETFQKNLEIIFNDPSISPMMGFTEVLSNRTNSGENNIRKEQLWPFETFNSIDSISLLSNKSQLSPIDVITLFSNLNSHHLNSNLDEATASDVLKEFKHHFDPFEPSKFYGLLQFSKWVREIIQFDQKVRADIIDFIINTLFRYLAHILFSFFKIKQTIFEMFRKTDFSVLFTIAFSVAYGHQSVLRNQIMCTPSQDNLSELLLSCVNDHNDETNQLVNAIVEQFCPPIWSICGEDPLPVDLTCTKSTPQVVPFLNLFKLFDELEHPLTMILSSLIQQSISIHRHNNSTSHHIDISALDYPQLMVKYSNLFISLKIFSELNKCEE